MEINEQQYLKDYITIAKTLDKVWCLKDKELNHVKGCLVRVAFYVSKINS